MKLFIFSFILLLNISVGFCADYTNIDKQSAKVPANLRKADEIAGYLTKNLTSKTDKVRALYYWISHNIWYDLAQMNSNKTFTSSNELVEEVLQKRKGVCQHYAELFHACCASIGIQSYVIKGYTIQNGQIAKLSHAWNTVVIDGKYLELDVTWAAGYVVNGIYKHVFTDEYFLIHPSIFIKTHIPFDPIWQFLDNPITNKEIEKGDFSKLKIKSGYNYTDSIKMLRNLSTTEQLVRENRRISKMGYTNTLIRNHVAQNQEIIASEKYNQAVQSFNKAVESFNFYILAKNKRFDGTKLADDKIREMLAKTRQHLDVATNLLNFLNSDNSEFNRQIRNMQSSISELKKNINDEDEFVNKYFKTAKSFRIALFYKLKK
jgi:hypothetical protein